MKLPMEYVAFAVGIAAVALYFFSYLQKNKKIVSIVISMVRYDRVKITPEQQSIK